MRNARLDELQARKKIGERNINNLRYVDDTTLMAESEEELKSLLMRVKEESERAGLNLNIKKSLLSFVPFIFLLLFQLIDIFFSVCLILLGFSLVVPLLPEISVQFSRSVVSDSLRPHESQHARPPCPSPTPGVHSDSRP